MGEHSISVHDIRHVEASMEFTGNALSEDEILRTNTHDNSIRQFNCSCGKEEMSYTEAVSHMQSVNDSVTPQTFTEIAKKVWKGEAVPTGLRTGGFVLKGKIPDTNYSGNPLKQGVVVGYEMGDKYIVGLMFQKTETVGRSEPRIKVHDNTYLECSLYEVAFDGIIENAERVAEYTVENGEKIDDGYINGYRLQSLDGVLDEIFKYHSLQ